MEERLKGLTLDEAKALVENTDMFIQVIREDDKGGICTADLRMNRIRVEIEQGKIVRAMIG